MQYPEKSHCALWYVLFNDEWHTAYEPLICFIANASNYTSSTLLPKDTWNAYPLSSCKNTIVVLILKIRSYTVYTLLKRVFMLILFFPILTLEVQSENTIWREQNMYKSTKILNLLLPKWRVSLLPITARYTGNLPYVIYYLFLFRVFVPHIAKNCQMPFLIRTAPTGLIRSNYVTSTCWTLKYHISIMIVWTVLLLNRYWYLYNVLNVLRFVCFLSDQWPGFIRITLTHLLKIVYFILIGFVTVMLILLFIGIS